MSETCFTFVEEPAGTTYRQLLDYGSTLCSSALLVLQPQLGFGARAMNVLRQLDPYLRSSEKATKWPGTQLFGGTAEVREYDLRRESVEILKLSADRLYEWLAPDLPEDLCLLRPDRSPWLVTIAHEQDAYLNATEAEAEHIGHVVPAIRLRRDPVDTATGPGGNA